MAFLFLSVALLPFSMKAVGFDINLTPRLGAAVEAWTQVAGVFVVGYHPYSAASWSSLDNLNTPGSPEITPENGEQCSLIAQLYTIGSGESCDLTREPEQTESVPAMEARSVAPQVLQKRQQRLSVRHSEVSGLAPVAEAITVRAEQDDVIVKVPANLPAVAMKFVRAFNAKPPVAPRRMKRAEREAFGTEVGRIMKDARFDKVANMTFEFTTSDKSGRADCDDEQVTHAPRGLELLERARRVRVIETENTHEL
ncbi:MAG TPA: hypothetical protein VE262_03275 [Blastocatellia bacterium]|nr:hypothetical protein [Blastocatellia bacterium]